MKTFMLRAMALVLLALVGCGDADPSGPGTEGRYATFTPDRSTYVPFRVARLELDGPAPGPGAAISGTIGGRAVELTTTSDSAVVVVVPAVAAGSHALSFAVSGREYRGSITVTAAAAMTDPVGYLDAVSEQARTTIAAMRADAETDAGPEHEAVLELLRIAEDSLAVFEARRASLSAGDAEVVAQALRANLTDVPEFTGPIGTGMSALQMPPRQSGSTPDSSLPVVTPSRRTCSRWQPGPPRPPA